MDIKLKRSVLKRSRKEKNKEKNIKIDKLDELAPEGLHTFVINSHFS